MLCDREMSERERVRQSYANSVLFMGSVKWRLFYIDLQYIENRSRASVDYVTTMFSEPLNVATPVLDAL